MTERDLAQKRRYACILGTVSLTAAMAVLITACGDDGATKANSAVEEELQRVLGLAVANSENPTPTISPTHHETTRNKHATPENMIPSVFRGFLNDPGRSVYVGNAPSE
jgi:hypothetical protein